MADTIEKVYCTGDGGNDNLAAALLARGRDNDPATMLAAMNGGMGNWMNNPFAYMMMMAWMRDWNNRGGNLQDTELQNQIASLRTQMQDGNNTALLMDAVKGNNVALGQLAQNLNCDMNQLQNAVCGVQAAIQDVGGKVGLSAERVINAANLGNLNIIQQLKDCCCQTQLGQKDIQNSMQRGFDFNNRSIERGFSALGFQLQQDKCDIIRANQDNTQRVIDVLNNHWQQDLQQRYNDARLELSQQRQNAELIAALKTTTTTTGA